MQSFVHTIKFQRLRLLAVNHHRNFAVLSCVSCTCANRLRHVEKKQVLNKVDSLRQELERAAPNRWRLDTVLGEGGYGVVVSAQNTKAPGRPLRAIKVILAAGGVAGARFTDREFKQMTREGEITQSLAHENVCRTFQVSPDPYLSFLCIKNDCSWSCQCVVDISGLFACHSMDATQPTTCSTWSWNIWEASLSTCSFSVESCKLGWGYHAPG